LNSKLKSNHRAHRISSREK